MAQEVCNAIKQATDGTSTLRRKCALAIKPAEGAARVRRVLRRRWPVRIIVCTYCFP